MVAELVLCGWLWSKGGVGQMLDAAFRRGRLSFASGYSRDFEALSSTSGLDSSSCLLQFRV